MKRPLLAVILFLVLLAPLSAKSDPVYRKDVEFALKTLKKECGHFFRTKDIDWKKVEARFRKDVRSVKTTQDHWVLLVRLVACIRDGHAYVKVNPKAGKLEWPDAPKQRPRGPGMFFCRSGKKILVKMCWGAAEQAGVKAGMEVMKVDKIPASKWLEAKVAEMREYSGYSTDEQAFYAACHWGLTGDPSKPFKVELRTVDGKVKKKTISCRESGVPVGPAVFPPNLQHVGRQSYGKTEDGWAYIHIRKCEGGLPDQFDTMLAAVGDAPGLILDCRANGGGACDHDAVLGRFVPEGEKLNRSGGYPIPSAGAKPYAGPMVVIIDAGVCSAGETVSGMFKEDGRGYMIGESHTAGMSSSKKTIELPSGLFALYVSVRSNKKRFNGGQGIEGIGVKPHEIVEYDAKDLDQGIDTLIKRAGEILSDYRKVTKGKVPYRVPKDWWK
jgi:C-terminal processing protease CtpA/Prc